MKNVRTNCHGNYKFGIKMRNAFCAGFEIASDDNNNFKDIVAAEMLVLCFGKRHTTLVF